LERLPIFWLINYKIIADKIPIIGGEQYWISDIKEGYFYLTGTLFGRRTLITTTTSTSTTTKTTVIIQKDLDLDGIIDKDITFEAVDSFTSTTTFTTEINGFYLDDWFSNDYMFEGSLVEYRNSTTKMSDKSHYFIFRDYENGEVSSTRIYEDVFPNELSEISNLDNYQKTISNDNNDENPSNDIIIQAPALEDLLDLRHPTDDVPALFDSTTTITDSIAMDNILATQKTVSIPDSQTGLYKASSTLNIIQVIPEDGKVFVDSNPRHNPEEVRINGEYWYYSSSQNGIFDTIFVVDENKEVLAIGFDYDFNSFLEPNKKIFSEKHIISSGVAKGIDFSNLKPSNGVFLRDYKQYNGNFLDHTFTDSLYDIWKMSYTPTTSKLMKEVSSITSSQFIKAVKGRLVEDIIWQVGAQLMAFATSILSLTGLPGYLLTYGLLSARRTNLQSKVRKQLIAAQTLYNEDFEGEITLSTRKAYDKLWGGTLPNIVGGSTAGVYTHVQLETDKHLFKGDLLLAPSGVKKTSSLGLENKPISLDYTTQKGSYVIYSDFYDSRLAPYIKLPSLDFDIKGSSFEDQIEVYYASLDQDLPYMQNSMMYLEDVISKQSSGQYDTIYPYMMYLTGAFVPTFQFGGIDAKYPIPEFFHDYPVIVDQDSYEKLKDEYSTIYKVIDSDSSQDIELIPKDTRHRIYGEIDHIDVYFINSLGENHQLSSYTEDEGHYSYNKTTGILTLSDGSYYALQYVIDLHKRNNQDIEDFDAYYILEIKVEKYRSASNLNGMTQEAINNIATMQAIEQNILEYTYQYKQAQNTQKGLSEMFYTVFITTISTLITVGITLGISHFIKPPSVAVDFAGLKYYDSLIAGANSAATNTIMEVLGGAVSQSTKLALITSPIKESIQEIFVDPYIDTIVSNIVASVGGDVALQVLFSSLVEGGREGISGPLSQFIFGNTQTNTQVSVDTQHLYQEINPTDQNAVEYNIEAKEYSLKYSPKLSSFIKTGASLILGAALMSLGGPMFFGATIASGLVALQSISKDFKIQKNIIQNIVSHKLPSDYNLNDVIADETNTLINVGLKDATTTIQVGSISKSEKPSIKEGFFNKLQNLKKSHAYTTFGLFGLGLLGPEMLLFGATVAGISIMVRKIANMAKNSGKASVARQIDETTREFITEIRLESINFRNQYVKKFSGQQKTVYTSRFRKLDFTNSLVKPLTQNQISLKFQEASKDGLNPYLTYAIISLDSGFIRVGKTHNSMPVRWTKYKNRAFNAKNPERGNFYDEMRSNSIYDSKGNLDLSASFKKVSEKFVRILIDCQYGNTPQQSEMLGAISEEFYTIFVNRDMSHEEGFNLEINNKYNHHVGDTFGPGALNPHWINVDIDLLLDLVKQGFTKFGVAYILGVSYSTVEKRVENIAGGKSYEKFQVELISQVITAMVSQGYTGLQISKNFHRFDIDQKDIFSVVLAKKSARAGKIKVMTYNPQSMETFLRPIILEFIIKGMTLDEISVELKNLEIINLNRKHYTTNALKLLIPRLFEGRTIEKMRQIYMEPIIENLLRAKDEGGKYLGAFKIVVQLGWASETDSRDMKQTAADRLMSFLKARWGFTKITDARNFFIEHFLGNHEYDYFYLN